MTPPIEYLLRNGRAQQLLKLPCTLLLQNRKKNTFHNKIVAALSPVDDDFVSVKHYTIWKASRRQALPPFTEQIIPLGSVFVHPSVIIPTHKILDFKEEPFDGEEKQITDMPLSVLQEEQYNGSVRDFYSPTRWRKAREGWLWNCFERIHLIPAAKENKAESYSDFIATYMPAVWDVWEQWKKNLLDFEGDISPELIFAWAYNNACTVLAPKQEIYIDPLPSRTRRQILRGQMYFQM